MLWKSQQVLSLAYKDIHSLIWKFQSENSTKKMLLQAKQKLQNHLLPESCNFKQILVHRKRTYSR